jgi:hypothetical protein
LCGTSGAPKTVWGSSWENGTVGSFNARLRDELLDGEIFSRREAQVISKSWRRHYNTVRPHSSRAVTAMADHFDSSVKTLMHAGVT